LNHWNGLTRVLDDGRIELDTNIVERSIRPIVINRKKALFAGHDQCVEKWPALRRSSKLHYAARGIRRFMPPAELCRTGLFSPGFAVTGM